MARIAGIDLPKNKKIEFALMYIYGIGRTRAKEIMDKSGISPEIRVKDLTESQVSVIVGIVNAYVLEGDLRREVAYNVRRLIDINCYRGFRHRKGLPVRGQRTKTNARTRKRLKKLTVGNKI